MGLISEKVLLITQTRDYLGLNWSEGRRIYKEISPVKKVFSCFQGIKISFQMSNAIGFLLEGTDECVDTKPKYHTETRAWLYLKIKMISCVNKK